MFSGAVKLGDLNDYIAPSQACVVALQGGKIAPGQDDGGATTAAPEAAAADADGLVLQRRRAPRVARAAKKAAGFQQTYTEAPRAGEDAGQGAVRVTLHDCLACAGCVTSAETVLLQQQSAGELLQRLREQREAEARGETTAGAVVVSISPQSRASLAALHGLPSAADAHLRLATFFKEVLGARAVLDLGVAREVALLEAAEEFCARYGASGRLASAARALRAAGADRAAAAAEAALAGYRRTSHVASSSSSPPASVADGPLPVLTSACPGWVCYAEKTASAHAALPHLSSARSPQGVMGLLVKRRRRRHGQEGGLSGLDGSAWGPGKVYHVTVMPCYDKKLEAARDELAIGGGAGARGQEAAAAAAATSGTAAATLPLEPEVDCCLATSEVQALLEVHGCGDLAAVEPARELDTLDGRTLPAAAFFLPYSFSTHPQEAAAAGGAPVDQPPLHDRAWGSPGSLPGSGGWASFVMRYAARRLFGMDLRPYDEHEQQFHQGAAAGNGGNGSGDSGGGRPFALSVPAPRRLRNGDMHELALEVRHALEAEGMTADAAAAAAAAAAAGDAADAAASAPSPPPPLLRFAAAYGFRNIQAVVRRLPPPPSPSSSSATAAAYYDLVEIMACPSGCLNGGGQMNAIKAVVAAGVGTGAGAPPAARATGNKAAATLDALEAYFAGAPGPEVSAMDFDGAATGAAAAARASPAWEPGRSAAAQRAYQELGLLAPEAGQAGDGAAAAAAAAVPGSAAARAPFHTTFRLREKTLASTVGDW